jgi:hypothetical protein
MSHEHDESEDAAPATAEPTREARAEPIPDFLARARRILGGDIRPEDYLPVTPEVRAAADFEMAHARALTKVEPLPEVVTHQLRGWLLSFHHGGENIIYVSDDKGVIVLAAGLDQVGEFMRNIPDEMQDGITAGCPEPF